jgi:hypothetical protein
MVTDSGYAPVPSITIGIVGVEDAVSGSMVTAKVLA